MGARISIDLQGLLNHPSVSVELFTEKEILVTSNIDEVTGLSVDEETIEFEHRAKVNFKDAELLYYFSYSAYANNVILEGDFNFFRNEEGHKRLMRALFECSVPFTVIPG